jgi:cell division transport system ATP-binding protein
MIEMVDVRLDHPRGGSATRGGGATSAAPLLTDASMKVTRGEVVMIVGAAGVGTSRMVAALLGEVPASAGRIEVMGRDLTKLRRASLRLLRRRTGVVPQDLCLLEDRSAQLNVVLPLEIDGIPRSMSMVRAGEVLEELGLEDQASLPVDCLSASERQRVAVARALIRRPEIVIADHPTSMQYGDGIDLVCNALARAAADGAAVVVFGRDHALRVFAEHHRWRMLALVDGKLGTLAQAAPAAIDQIMETPLSAPTPLRPDAEVEEIPNVVPFPLSARTAGVA